MQYVLTDKESFIRIRHQWTDMPQHFEVFYANYPLRPVFVTTHTIVLQNRAMLLQWLHHHQHDPASLHTLYLNQMQVLEEQRMAVEWLDQYWNMPFRQKNLAKFHQEQFQLIDVLRRKVGHLLRQDIDRAILALENELR